jgi:hypothetical protein
MKARMTSALEDCDSSNQAARGRPPARDWRGASARRRLPVSFWIHGGALVTGTGAIYHPSVIANAR